MTNDDRKRLTTSRLLSHIRGAGSAEDATAWHDQESQPVFSDLLYALMQKNHYPPKQMILLLGIERSYFYHILSGKRLPSRNLVLRIALVLHAGLQDTNRLLRLAGAAALYPKVRRDALLIYALENSMSAEQVNLLLTEKNEEPLYRESRS